MAWKQRAPVTSINWAQSRATTARPVGRRLYLLGWLREGQICQPREWPTGPPARDPWTFLRSATIMHRHVASSRHDAAVGRAGALMLLVTINALVFARQRRPNRAHGTDSSQYDLLARQPLIAGSRSRRGVSTHAFRERVSALVATVYRLTDANIEVIASVLCCSD